MASEEIKETWLTQEAYDRLKGELDTLSTTGREEIAKRIEAGLKDMVQAISACPAIVEDVVGLGQRIAEGTSTVDEVVDGIVDEEDEPVGIMPFFGIKCAFSVK